jgi:hypothetical protein
VLAVLAHCAPTLPTRLAGFLRREFVRRSLLVSRASPHAGDFSTALFVHSGKPATFRFFFRHRSSSFRSTFETPLTRRDAMREAADARFLLPRCPPRFGCVTHVEAISTAAKDEPRIHEFPLAISLHQLQAI